jgi:Ca2+/Na+ antiporter
VKISQFFFFNAIFFIGLGIAFTLYGPLMVNFYGILETESSGVAYWYVTSFARMFGVILFGYGFLIWAIKNVPEDDKTSPEVRRKIIFAQLIASLVGLAVVLIQQITIWWNITGWLTVAAFLVLVIGYFYYLILDHRVSINEI